MSLDAKEKYDNKHPAVAGRVDPDTKEILTKIIPFELSHLDEDKRTLSKLIPIIIDEWLTHRGYVEIKKIFKWNKQGG